MLAFALRGIVLVVVLSWYSTSVWKMIDGYFKARFDKYLKEEFHKNPRMKKDIEAHTSVKIRTVDVISEDTCQVDSCPAGKVGDEIPVQKDAAQEIQEKPRDILVDDKPLNGDNKVKRQAATEMHGELTPAIVQQRKPVSKVRKKPTETSKSGRKKKKVKTLVFTEEDFEEVRRKIQDYDFSEFEYEDELPEGIPVTALGYKPKADIGNLDRVSEDEYCPVAGETDCSQTKRWP